MNKDNLQHIAKHIKNADLELDKCMDWVASDTLMGDRLRAIKWTLNKILEEVNNENV